MAISALLGDSCPILPRFGISRSTDEAIQQPATAPVSIGLHVASIGDYNLFQMSRQHKEKYVQDADGEAVLNGFIHKTEN